MPFNILRCLIFLKSFVIAKGFLSQGWPQYTQSPIIWRVSLALLKYFGRLNKCSESKKRWYVLSVSDRDSWLTWRSTGGLSLFPKRREWRWSTSLRLGSRVTILDSGRASSQILRRSSTGSLGKRVNCFKVRWLSSLSIVGLTKSHNPVELWEARRSLLDVLALKYLIVITRPSYLMLNSGAAPGKVKMRLRGEYWWQWFWMLRKVKIVFGEMLSFWRQVGFGEEYPGLQFDRWSWKSMEWSTGYRVENL